MRIAYVSPAPVTRGGAGPITAISYVPEPDFLTRVGRFPTALRATSVNARPPFLAASERLPVGLFDPALIFLPTAFLAASPAARADFFAASDSSPEGVLFFD
jgi:hypothetical protein